MNLNKFNFSVSEFNKIFPYYILLNNVIHRLPLINSDNVKNFLYG